MTLLDFPGKVACTVFLGGCDFRCPFCHNADLLDMNAPALMDDRELIRFLETRKTLLEGVAFTGGEPLLRHDLPELFKEIKEMGFPIKLDTNGNHPEALKKIVEAGLADYVAMDVKHSPEGYGTIIGLDRFDTSKVSESIDFLRGFESPDFDYEFRTTAVREFHRAEDFQKIGEWIGGAKKYYIQNFVDRESVMYGGLSGFQKEELDVFQRIAAPYVGLCEVRGE